ncbi:MAG: alpha/beta hydrolase [Psychrobacillus sp.]
MMNNMLATLMRNGLGVAFFPLTLWNMTMNYKNKINPPGTIVKTEKSSIHVLLEGEGKDVVVLEAGLGAISIDWTNVQSEVSKRTKVLSYDRGNYGWSKTSRQALTALDYVAELKELLEKLNLQPPYILVGHSFGGLTMRLYASMYPEQVKGLVLVDAVHENQYMHNNQNRGYRRLVTLGYVTSLIGLPRILKQKAGRKFLVGKVNRYLNYTGYTIGAYQTLYREYMDSATSAEQLTKARPILNDLPIIVLSSNNPEQRWIEQQLLLSKLTARTEHIQTDKGHSIHLEDPSVVVNAIIKLLNLGESKNV